MDLGLNDRVAVVTAASKGLGKASAAALAAEGAHVVICARGAELLETTADELREMGGGEVIAVSADLSEADGVSKVIDEATSRFGRVDILVANSGGPPRGSFWEFDDDDWREAFELVNLSTIRLIRGFVPLMRERGWGRVIGIQSLSAKQPVAQLDLSNGTRPAIAGLIKALATELVPDGITANLVLPGVFLTDRLRPGITAAAESAGRSFEEQAKIYASAAPIGRLGQPEELAALVAFLASERASYISGAVYQVDGGMCRSNV